MAAKSNPIHDAILKVMDSMETAAPPVENPQSPPSQDVATETATGVVAGQDESPDNTPSAPEASTDAPRPDTPTAEAPQKDKRRGTSWKQRYKDQQSFNDRRFAQMQQEVEQLRQQLQSAQAPSEPEDLSDIYSDPIKLAQHQKRLVRSTLEEDYGLDPQSVAALKLPAEVAKYRKANPGMDEYDELVVPLAGKLAGNNPVTAQHLNAALDFSQTLVDALNRKIARATEAAKQQPVQPEATASKGQPVTQKTPITPEQRATLQKQTSQLTTERGISADGLPQKRGRNFNEIARNTVLEVMGSQG